MRISDWSSDVCSSDLRWRRCKFGFRLHWRGQSGGFWDRLAPDRRHDDTRRRIDAADVAISEPARTTARIVHRHGGRDGHLCRRAGAHNVQIVRSQHACGCGEITAGIESVIDRQAKPPQIRSEEHTSELQSLMRISYAVFCLKKKKTRDQKPNY